MNHDNLTAKELIHYLDLYSEDPVVRRLVTLLQEDSLMCELVDVGMDEDTLQFKDDWQYYSPGDYISHLRNDLDYYVRECDDLQNEVYDLQKEIKNMSTISLVSFIADVKHKMDMTIMEKDRALARAEEERVLRKSAEQKFEFWDKMNHGIK